MMTMLRNLAARLLRRPFRYISLDEDVLLRGVALGLMRRDGRVYEFTPKGQARFQQYLERLEDRS